MIAVTTCVCVFVHVQVSLQSEQLQGWAAGALQHYELQQATEPVPRGHEPAGATANLRPTLSGRTCHGPNRVRAEKLARSPRRFVRGVRVVLGI